MTDYEKRLLVRALVGLRSEYKEIGREHTGRAPLVCSDSAIVALAELRPKKIEDLANIPDIGEHFIQNYGEDFIELIKEYSLDEAEHNISITNEITHVLKELEKKLTNLNMRNKMLFCPKTTARTNVDLYPVFSTISYEDFLIKKKTIDIKEYDIYGNDKLYTKCKNVVRESSKEYRDKGQNNLYLGFPFVKGCLLGEKFLLRAPLVLWPISADINTDKVTLKIDDNRDVQFNNALILAVYKFNKIKEALPEESTPDFTLQNYIDEIINHYNDNHL